MALFGSLLYSYDIPTLGYMQISYPQFIKKTYIYIMSSIVNDRSHLIMFVFGGII